MKRKTLFMLIGIIFIGLCLIIYLINANSSKQTTIDLTGGNDLWQASLNIQLDYDSELIIQPGRDDFNIPSEISIDIIVNNKRVYTDRLKYIPDPQFRLGQYTKVRLTSKDYFKKGTKNVHIIIRYNGESSSILLNQNPIH
jgi:hypothetical protein